MGNGEDYSIVMRNGGCGDVCGKCVSRALNPSTSLRVSSPQVGSGGRPSTSLRFVHAKRARRAVGAGSAPDFQNLMDAAATKRDPAAALMSDSLDRTTVALSMARGGANPVEIAKSLGLTRGEVDLIITNANQK